MKASVILLATALVATTLAGGEASARVRHAPNSHVHSHAHRVRSPAKTRYRSDSHYRPYAFRAGTRHGLRAVATTRRASRFRALGRRAAEPSIPRGPMPPRVRVAMRFLGSRNPTRKPGPWCGHFQNLVESLTGRGTFSHGGFAPAWAGYGHPSGPIPGAIAVFRGHVGIVVKRVGEQVEIISGNYGHRVGLGLYRVRSAIAYRS